MKYVIDVDDDKVVKALNALGVETEEVKEDKNIVKEDWLKIGKKFYFINSWGEIGNDAWHIAYNTDIHDNQLSIGNVFETREEAEFALERLKILHELSCYTTEKPINPHYILKFHYPSDIDIIRVDDEPTFIGALAFATKEDAGRALEEGEDRKSRIIKYLTTDRYQYFAEYSSPAKKFGDKF